MGRGGGRDSPSCAFFFLRIPSCAVSNRHPCTKMPVQAGGSRNLTLGVQFFFILTEKSQVVHANTNKRANCSQLGSLSYNNHTCQIRYGW
uniref:Uncharacterized protein n=1 Tax=Aegilops tauschii subsp. strangulata TaxID=200361 RepID=A0A453MVH3_AEGTS